MAEKKTGTTKPDKQGFTKAQLMQAKRYKGVDKDIMGVVLDDNDRYTHDQVKKAIEDFKKGKVK